MADVKYTPQLSEMMEHAKQLGRRSGAQVTAERYLLTVLELLDGSFSTEAPQSFDRFVKMAAQDSLDLSAMKDALLTYINEGKPSFMDSMYLQQKLIEAKAKAVMNSQPELTAEMLLDCILADPSEEIRRCMSEHSAQEDGAEQEGSAPSLDEMIARSEDLISKLNAAIPQISVPASGDHEIKEEGAAPAQKPEQSAAEQPAPKQSKPQELDAAGISGLLGGADSVLSQLSGGSRQEKPESGRPAAEQSEKLTLPELVQKVAGLRSRLSEVVFGQDHAVSNFANGFFQGELLSMTDPSRVRPRATFLFAGPPGVGKTLLAEEAAKALGLPFMRFDMSEYADKEANIEFAGSDKVYKSAKEGNVTGFVAKNPRCVLLFDEIEKANLVVIHLFLQLLDAGRLRDNFTDEEVSFKDAVIFFTTNAGRGIYEENDSDSYALLPRKTILRAIEQDVNPVTGGAFFPAAILSRFSSGNVVMFNHIPAHQLVKIARREILRQADNFSAANGIEVETDERIFPALLLSEGGAADARAIRGRSESFFVSELYELLRLVASEKIPTGVDALKKISLEVALPEDRPEVLELFCRSEKPKLLLFAGSETAEAVRSYVQSCEIISTDSNAEAQMLLKKQPADLVLADLSVGMRSGQDDRLNIEDAESEARDFYRWVSAHYPSLPLYILRTDALQMTSEEENTYLQQGVRGMLALDPETLGSALSAITEELHQQAGMLALARANKAVTFETAQSVTEDGTHAHITLFDFALKTAVDAEDQGNVLSAVSRPDVRFDQVIGAEDAKKELQYFVQYLKNPKKYLGTGVAAPKGVLLYGPPGTGKTMLAKAMACESDVTFIAAEGNQFLKKYVGEGPELVHRLFRTARKYAPSILFVDEIDTIARKRTGSDQNHASEEILTAFLAEMDGFKKDPTKPVFVLAATNYDVDERSDKGLDSAMMRRFDRRVYIDLPRREDRVKFIRMKLTGNPAYAVSDAQVENLTVRSTGMSLAQLESVFELALRSAIRAGSTQVTDAVLEEAFETFNSGDTKEWSPETLERTARHEAGHTFLCWESGEKPSYVTIVARGDHGGYMQHGDHEDKPLYTREELLSRIRTALGGRAAEIVYYGDEDGISTGASGDLEQATNTARSMICYYGMTKEFGLSVVDRAAASNGVLSALVRETVNRILDEQMQEAVSRIERNKAAVDALVEALIQRDHLTGDEIDSILSANAASGAAHA